METGTIKHAGKRVAVSGDRLGKNDWKIAKTHGMTLAMVTTIDGAKIFGMFASSGARKNGAAPVKHFDNETGYLELMGYRKDETHSRWVEGIDGEDGHAQFGCVDIEEGV